MSSKHALLIGIGYAGQGIEMPGAVEETTKVHSYLRAKGYQCKVLCDGKIPSVRYIPRPTKDNIQSAVIEFMASLHRDNLAVIYYNGHGGNSNIDDIDSIPTDEGTPLPEDKQNHDIKNNAKEGAQLSSVVWVPADYETSGQITGDFLQENICEKVPKGVKITVISDSFHDGSPLNLPFIYDSDWTIRKADQTNALAANIGAFRPGAFRPGASRPGARNSTRRRFVSDGGSIICFSGKRDLEGTPNPSFDGKSAGLITESFLSTMNALESAPKFRSLNKCVSVSERLTYKNVLLEMTKITSKNNEFPMLSSSYELENGENIRM